MMKYVRPRFWPLPLLLSLLTIHACKVLQEKSTPTKIPPPVISPVQLRSNITSYAKKQVGAPYKYAGTDPKSGFDCSGFTSYVLAAFDIKISPGSAQQAKQGKAVPLDQVRAGDLIIFGDKSHIQHVAMVVERSNKGIFCVHSTTSRGVVIENISTSSYWKPLILYARDVIGGG